MGTHFRVVLYSLDDRAATQASKAAFQRIREIDEICSDYKDESELSRLSRSSGGSPQIIGHDLFTVLKAADEVAQATNGAFDVTCGPLVQLYRKSKRMHKLPADSQIRDALARVGRDKLKLDSAKSSAQLTASNMLLDLGAIAKGYACDEAIKTLKRRGISMAIVEGGGGQAVLGSPPAKTGWEIDVAPPPQSVADSTEKSSAPKSKHTKQTQNALATTKMERPCRVRLPSGYSIATSGNAFQYFEIDGVKYSHHLDPRSGKFLTTSRQVTVIHQNGAMADALGTAICVLGPERGIRLAEEKWSAACIVFEPGPTGFVVHTSSNWRKFAIDSAKPEKPSSK